MQSEAKTNSLFDTEYNMGFSNGAGEFNRQYANIDESAQMRIPTFEESTDKKAASSDVAKRLEELKFSRSNEAQGNMMGQFGGARPNLPTMPQMLPQQQVVSSRKGQRNTG